MKNQRPTGSFGLPEDMLKAINEVKKKQKDITQDQPDQPVHDVEEQVKQAPKPEKENPRKEDASKQDETPTVQEVVDRIKKDLRIDLDDDDVWALFSTYKVTKRGVCIIPDKLYATFATLTIDDNKQIDRLMAEDLDTKRLEDGHMTVRTQHLLSRGVLELGKRDNLKSIGDTPEERFEELGKMSALVVDRIGRKWNTFTFIVDQLLKEGDELKNV